MNDSDSSIPFIWNILSNSSSFQCIWCYYSIVSSRSMGSTYRSTFRFMLLKKLLSSRHLKMERLLGKRKAQKKSNWPWESAFLLRNIASLNKSDHFFLAGVSNCDQHHWQRCRRNSQQRFIYLLRNDLTAKIHKTYNDNWVQKQRLYWDFAYNFVPTSMAAL